jgi:hypothetical protein
MKCLLFLVLRLRKVVIHVGYCQKNEGERKDCNKWWCNLNK